MSEQPIQIDSQDVPWLRYAGRFLAIAITVSVVVSFVLWVIAPVAGVVSITIIGFAHATLLVVLLFYYVTAVVCEALEYASIDG